MPETTTMTPDLPKLARQAWLQVFQASRWLRPLVDDVVAERPRPVAARAEAGIRAARLNEVNTQVAAALFSWGLQSALALRKCYAELNDHLGALPAVDEALNDSISDALTIVALASVAADPGTTLGQRGPGAETFDADDFHAAISAAVRRLEARVGGSWGSFDSDTPLRWAGEGRRRHV